jgi:type III secretory pathway component EscU
MCARALISLQKGNMLSVFIYQVCFERENTNVYMAVETCGCVLVVWSTEKNVFLQGVLTLLVTVSVILGTAGFAQHMEGWSFGDAVRPD